MCVGFFAADVLPNAVDSMRVNWKLGDGPEAALAELIAADGNDWSAKKQAQVVENHRSFLRR
eukprot:7087383-Pyramimonas_sp.AAC.1